MTGMNPTGPHELEYICTLYGLLVGEDFLFELVRKHFTDDQGWYFNIGGNKGVLFFYIIIKIYFIVGFLFLQN